MWQQFFIAWRRFAGGLGPRAQETLRRTVDPFLAPEDRAAKKPKGLRPLAFDDVVTFRRSDAQVKVVLLEPGMFYEVLRAKLAWAELPRGRAGTLPRLPGDVARHAESRPSAGPRTRTRRARGTRVRAARK